MQRSPETRFDVASVLSVGARDYQEDALALDFPDGSDFGYAVLADGMGGHAAGDVASRIVVQEVFKRLKATSGDIQSFSHNVHDILSEAARKANASVREHTDENPAVRGMGATLVATVVLNNLLYWISVGDSPLFLFRHGKLHQLNEDHSMAPQIDFLVSKGLMDPEVGRNHPDRSCLTSVLIGGSIERIDSPAEPFRLEEGDLLILASDGLQFLTDNQITAVIESCGEVCASEIAGALNDAIEDLDDPDQDNASFAVIRIGSAAESNGEYRVAWEDIDPKSDGADIIANPYPDSNEQPLNFAMHRASGGSRR